MNMKDKLKIAEKLQKEAVKNTENAKKMFQRAARLPTYIPRKGDYGDDLRDFDIYKEKKDARE